MRNPLLAPLVSWLRRLRHRQLFLVVASLFLIDVVVPDVVPFVDELLLAGATLWLSSRKKSQHPAPASSQQPPS